MLLVALTTGSSAYGQRSACSTSRGIEDTSCYRRARLLGQSSDDLPEPTTAVQHAWGGGPLDAAWLHGHLVHHPTQPCTLAAKQQCKQHQLQQLDDDLRYS